MKIIQDSLVFEKKNSFLDSHTEMFVEFIIIDETCFRTYMDDWYY